MPRSRPNIPKPRPRRSPPPPARAKQSAAEPQKTGALSPVAFAEAMAALERFQEKWKPVFRPEPRPDKEMEHFRDSVNREDAPGAPWPGAVALSGGGDSLALMHLLADWAKERGLPLPVALIVDHALRAGSAGEARKAAAFARKAGLAAHVLTRKGPVPRSGIEAAARDARYGLTGAWMREHAVATLYVGHTLDDQAETFLLRLGRGSGLDGLSAMRRLAPFPVPALADLNLARPLLGFSRASLRGFLKARRQSWLEDPMNSEARFARSRIRGLMPALEAAGLSPMRIADAAAHLARARAALELAAQAVLARAARPDGARMLLDPGALLATPREVGLRVLAGLLMGVSGEPYRPRFEALERLFDSIAAGNLGRGATLHGCRLFPATRADQAFGPETLVLARESSGRTR